MLQQMRQRTKRKKGGVRKPSKNNIVFVLCWPSTSGHGAFPNEWFVYPVRLHQRKWISLYKRPVLGIVSGLEMEAGVHFRSQSWDPIWHGHVQALWMLPQKCVHPVISGKLFPCSLSPLTFSLQPLPQSSQTSHSGRNVPRSLTLYILSSCGFLYLFL